MLLLNPWPASNSKKSLFLDLAKQIAVAVVISKLDYCNSLFPNMPEKDTARLQRLARVATKAPRFSRSFLLKNDYIGFLSSFAFILKYAH